MNNNDVKIFISYYKPSVLLKNDVFVPMHVGRALKKQWTGFAGKWLKENLVGDDTGKNISNKNPHYNELTAQYWAWKNLPKNIEYIGFMHYRRHLNFTDTVFPINKWGLIERQDLDDNYIKDFGLDEKNIKQFVKRYDVITVEPWDVTNAGSESVYDHYAHGDPKLHIKDYDLTLKVLKKKYPEYAKSADEYNKSVYGYFTNIFVMRRDIFDKYNEWLFNILFEVEKKSDISNYDFQEARIYGYLSEWLFGIFVTHLKKTTDLKIKELQRTMVQNTDIREPINICFTSDNNYAKYMGVAIASILKNKDVSDVINIYVLDGGISDARKQEIARLSSIAPFNIEYIKVDENATKDCPINRHHHFTVATWYKCLLPFLPEHIDKVIYLDCDLVVNTSLYPLYAQDVSKLYFKGVIDVLNQENTERLHLEKYCNAGVMLINLAKWRKDNLKTKFFKYINEHHDDIVWADQDVVNIVCQNGIEYIDQRWNTQITDYSGGRTEEYRAIGENGFIMHFISSLKPWKNKYSHWSRYYYQYLKITPWKKDSRIYYIAVVKRVLSNIMQDVFSVKDIEEELPKKRVKILRMRFKFVRKTEFMRREFADLRWRIEKINAKLEQKKSGK